MVLGGKMISIFDDMEKAIEPVQNFIEKNYSNPLLWIGLFVGLFLLAKFIYSSLQKEK